MLIQSFAGIRGIYGKELNENTARRYAHVFNRFLKEKAKKPLVIIGNDPRQSSEPLKNAVLDVFENIIDIGIVTTPMAELAVRDYKADGGVMLTASHNEPEYNGFKFLDKDGAVLRPNDIERIISGFNKIKELKKADFLDLLSKEKTILHKIDKKHNDIIDRYYTFITKIIEKKNVELIKKSDFKVILDPKKKPRSISKETL